MLALYVASELAMGNNGANPVNLSMRTDYYHDDGMFSGTSSGYPDPSIT
jgi:hypothetical protein